MAAGWRPEPARLGRLVADNVPLALADLADWGARRLDVFILGRLTGSEAVGVYYVAQQLASLPQKLKSSFDPILAPLLTAALARDDRAAVAGHLRQVGFWVLMAQLLLIWPMGLTGEGTLGTIGPGFAAGAAVLAFLFAAEVVAGQASVAESALVYVRPGYNLTASAIGLSVQALATVPLVRAYGPAGAAAGLALGFLVAMLLKAVTLRRALGVRAGGWRLAALLTSLPVIAVGLAARQLPELWEMVLGIPAMLLVYAGVAWFVALKAPDRLLFRKLGT